MADEFKIVASLDIPKSVQEINKDIPKLQGQSKHLKIIADLDPKLSIKNIQATLNKMNNNANIKIGIDASGLNSVQGATQNITNNLKNVQAQAQQAASAVSDSYKQQAITVEGTIEALKNKWIELYKIEHDGAVNNLSLTKFEKSLQAIVPFIEKDKILLNDLYSNLERFYSTDFLRGLVTDISRLDREYNIFSSVQDKVNSQFKTTIDFSADSAYAVETLYERFRILTNQLLKYKGVTKSIDKLSNKFIKENPQYLLGDTQPINDFAYYVDRNLTKAERDILNFYGNAETVLRQLFDSFKMLGYSMGDNRIVDRLNTLDLDTIGVYLKPMKDFLAGEQQAIADAKILDDAYYKLQSTLRKTFGESNLYQNGQWTVTLDQLKAVVAEAPLAQKFIDEIESKFAKLPTTSTQSTKVVNSNMAKVEEQSRETTVAIEQQAQAMEKLNNVQSSASATNSNTNNIANTSKLFESFKSSLANMNLPSEQIDSIANKISGLNVEITSLNQSMSVNEKNGKRMLSVDISGTDKLGNAVKLTQQYNLETGDLVKTIDALSSATQKSSSQLDNLMAQQIKRKADLKNQVKQMYKAAIDPNASRSITNTQNLDVLKTKYDEIKLAIDGMDGKSKTAFAQQEADISKLISDLKIVINQYKNAENVSTTLKPDKLASAISKAESQFQVLNTNIQNAGVSSDKLTQNIQLINSVLSKTQTGGVINKAEIEQVFTALSNARNELEALIKMKTSDSAIERVRIQAETLVSSLNTFANNNVGFDKFTTTVNGAVISVDSLKQSLATVNSQSDLSIIRSQITALETAFKETAVDSDKYVTQINSAITKLQSLANSPIFTKNASNSQVTQTKQEINSLITAYQNLMTKLQGNITPAGLETVRTALTQLNARFNTTTTTAKQFESELKNDNGAEKLAQKVAVLTTRIEAYRKANSKSEKKFGSQYNDMLSALKNPNIDENAYNRIAKQFQVIRQEVNAANVAGKNFLQTFKEKLGKFTGWMSMTYAVSLFTRSIREAITELKEVDTVLTEISKANDKLTKSQLAQIGSNSFEIASKYGKQATDYLSGVQEMSRAGYANAEAMGELSTAAQGAGDMTADVANQFIIAADKAYKMNGSVEELTKTLDGINYITNNNAVNMSELSEGFSIVSSTAASFGVGANELTAALGTMAATTQQSGSEVARAFRAILLNIRQVSDKWLLSSNQFAPYVQKCA